MSQVVDSLAYTGLDTLSERALRRLTDGWTGELFTSDEVGAVLNEQEVASTGTFNAIVEGWQRARELYHDADIEAVMGPVSRLAEGVVSGEESVAAAQSDIMAEQMITASEWWNPAQWTGELYGLLAIVLFLSYIFCLYRYLPSCTKFNNFPSSVFTPRNYIWYNVAQVKWWGIMRSCAPLPHSTTTKALCAMCKVAHERRQIL